MKEQLKTLSVSLGKATQSFINFRFSLPFKKRGVIPNNFYKRHKNA